MFENKYAKLPDEPAITNVEIDPSSSTMHVIMVQYQSSTRKRSRFHSSKHNVSISGQHHQ